MSFEIIMTIIGLAIIILLASIMFVFILINIFTDETGKTITKNFFRRLKKNDELID
ncbi:MAG: hypothetical protein ACTSSH_13680 [Candidatus Heimdallarchaeota archaeon]